MQPLFVGDVQGCADELEEVIARAERSFGSRYELWVVGDVVNRGPFSLRALERVRDLVERGRGRIVLGNHEIALLRAAFGQRALGPVDTMREILERPDGDEWIEWVRCRPLVEAGWLGDWPFLMVHAAVDPTWAQEAAVSRARSVAARLSHPQRAVAQALLGADPGRDGDLDALARLVTCRSVAPDGRWSSEPPGEGRVAWHQAWSARGHAYGVVYGHWSLQGLHVAPGLRGLDTGCVHHGRGRDGFLTAWVPDGRPRPFAVPDGRFWRFRAHRRYIPEGVD